MTSHLTRSKYTGSLQFAQSSPSFRNADNIKKKKKKKIKLINIYGIWLLKH